jgi:hypothetical protein
LAKWPEIRIAGSPDFATHDLHSAPGRGQPIGHRKFEEKAAEIIPLVFEKPGALVRREIWESEVDVALGDAR